MSKFGETAVIIGGSLAGLMTAQVLAGRFSNVRIIERDEIDPGPKLHKSIPQGNHYHALLAGGLRVMQGLFPNFAERLTAAGAVPVKGGEGTLWYSDSGVAYDGLGIATEPRPTDNHAFTQSRGCLESVVRACALELENLDYVSPATVSELLHENNRVVGVRCTIDGEVQEITADLIVDASGRGSRSPKWLDALGYQAPEQTTIGVDFAYSSAKFRMPPGYEESDERITICFGGPPDYPDGAICGAIEDGQLHVSLAGRFGNYPPTGIEEFIGFLRNVKADRIYELVKDVEPTSDPVRYRFPTSLRQHYERLNEFPEGYLVIGDGIASFNPVYGQGMSSAALQIEALDTLLNERVAAEQTLDGLAPEFFAKAFEITESPWNLAASQDLAFPQTTGERPPNMDETADYMQSIAQIATDDEELYQTVSGVFALTAPLSALFVPDIQEKVARLKR